MKKTKLLMPILGVGAVAATVAPMVAMTGCNKDEEEVGEFSLKSTNLKTNTAEACKNMMLMYNGLKTTKKQLATLKITGQILIDEKTKEEISLASDVTEMIPELNKLGYSEFGITWASPLTEDKTCKFELEVTYTFKDEKDPEPKTVEINGTITYHNEKVILL